MSLLILPSVSLTLAGVEGVRAVIELTKRVCRRSWSVVRSAGSMMLFWSAFSAALITVSMSFPFTRALSSS